MRGEQAIFNLEIKKKSGLSINPDIHQSKVFSSVQIPRKWDKDNVALLYKRLLLSGFNNPRSLKRLFNFLII